MKRCRPQQAATTVVLRLRAGFPFAKQMARLVEETDYGDHGCGNDDRPAAKADAEFGPGYEHLNSTGVDRRR